MQVLYLDEQVRRSRFDLPISHLVRVGCRPFFYITGFSLCAPKTSNEISPAFYFIYRIHSCFMQMASPCKGSSAVEPTVQVGAPHAAAPHGPPTLQNRFGALMINFILLLVTRVHSNPPNAGRGERGRTLV